MSQVHARAAHTLGEILLDHRTAEEKVKSAAKSAPFWVIAITAHLVLGFVLGMVVLRQEKAKAEAPPIEGELRQPIEDAKIVEKPEAEPEVVRTAIPNVPMDTTPVEFEQGTITDVFVNPDATESGTAGLDEGTLKDSSDVWSLSTSGHGLATAIGLGAGGHAGGGAPRGKPGAGTRIMRRNEQAANFQKGEITVNGALRWLKQHQSPDGSWDCDGFSANCDHKRGAACGGRGSAVFDAGVTGLALLAFLGAGYDGVHGNEHQDVVRNGLKYLRSIQDAEGCFGPTSDTRHTYAHACATIAMCEAYASTRQLPWRKSAENAVAYINRCQNTYKGWRYGKQPGDNDSSVTGWMLMALKAAKDAGIPVDPRTMKDGLAVIDLLTDTDTGRTGYTVRGEVPVRPVGSTKWPASESESLTAVAMSARIFCDASDSPLMKAGAELLAKKLPVWDEAKGSIDMYYWYYGTLAMFQMGGENWERWNKNLKTVVIDHQRTDKDGCLDGSWDPIDPWGEEGGRVYSTALMAMCLEVYYRYPRVFGTGLKKN
jgi:hypothetical protein